MTDLIIGCYSRYDWGQIKYWANSIDRCGFQGDKVAIVFDSDFYTARQLLDRKFNIFAFGRDDVKERLTYPGNAAPVHVQRFYHIWQYLTEQVADRGYEHVITTDVKDVIFQSDPSEWLAENLGDKQLVVGSESLIYEDEPWGDGNMRGGFPEMHGYMKSKTIYNCGVIAGKTAAVRDLCLNMYLISQHNPAKIVDQAAMNLIMHMHPWQQITKFAAGEDGWTCQAGTTVDPTKIEDFRPKLLEAEPQWDGGFSTTSDGRRHVILHQWDRVPAWSQHIYSNYQ
jgi:hypothetical protein